LACIKTAFATPSACPEQVTQDWSFSFLAFPTGDIEEPRLQTAEVALFAGVCRVARTKKESVFFYERSRYVIENTGSKKRTKPNEADFGNGKTVRCRGGLRLSRLAGDRRIRFGRGALYLPMTREPGRLPYPNKGANLKVGATLQPSDRALH